MLSAMTASAAHADAFYVEVLRERQVWTIRDGGGFPAPAAGGVRAMPFWSSRNRVQKTGPDRTQGSRPFTVPSTSRPMVGRLTVLGPQISSWTAATEGRNLEE
jgi:hypothetical protein